MKTKIVRKRHQNLVSFANIFIAPFLRKKAGFIQKRIDVRHLEPFIVVSNHVSAMDPIFLTGTFNRQIYYMASELTFSKGLISRLLVWGFSPIPKSKGQTDVGSVKMMIKTMNEGGNVGVFIEGDSTMNGTLSNIPTGIGKLVKMIKRPLIIYNFHGGYLSNPRWSSAKRRKRHFSGDIRHVLLYEDYKDMSVEEINDFVNQLINVNSYEENNKFAYVGKRNAEGLNRLLWMCPCCGGVNTLRAKGNSFNCLTCDFKSTYNEHGFLESSHFSAPQNMVELDEANKLAYQDYIVEHPEYVLSESGRFLEVFRRRRRRFGKATITLSKAGLNITFKRKDVPDVFYPFDALDSMEMQQKEVLIIYLKHEQTKMLKIPNTHLVGAYEFIVAFQIFKNINEQALNEEIFRKLTPSELGL